MALTVKSVNETPKLSIEIFTFLHLPLQLRIKSVLYPQSKSEEEGVLRLPRFVFAIVYLRLELLFS
jgi:hypothetical protein